MSTVELDVEDHPRRRLLRAAIEVLGVDGPAALQARRLTTEVGMSTMAVYTHFGGMSELVTEVMREGFIRFGQRLQDVPRGKDPVADLFALGLAYRDWAMENPQLYRLMFASTPPGGRPSGPDPVAAVEPDTLPEAQATFDQLIATVTRIIDAAGAHQEDASLAADQIWSATHGYAQLEIGGFFGGDSRGVERVLLPLVTKLAIGIGAPAEHASRTARRIAVKRAAPPANQHTTPRRRPRKATTP